MTADMPSLSSQSVDRLVEMEQQRARAVLADHLCNQKKEATRQPLICTIFVRRLHFFTGRSCYISA
jgi:hypothetical protein